MRLFWRKGFATASMNELCDAMGIRSPSLYAAFGSKEALYLEAMEHYVRTVGPPVWDNLLTATTARAAVEKVLLAGMETLPESEVTPAGCMAMLGAAGDEWPAAIVGIARNIRLEVLTKLHARLETGVNEGELPASTDIDGLSRFYLGVFQGMAVQARDGATSDALRGIATAAMKAWPGDGARQKAT